MVAHRFEFEGIPGVGRAILEFDPDSQIRVLFGVNGVGKTKCLEAISALYAFVWLAETSQSTWIPVPRVFETAQALSREGVIEFPWVNLQVNRTNRTAYLDAPLANGQRIALVWQPVTDRLRSSSTNGNVIPGELSAREAVYRQLMSSWVSGKDVPQAFSLLDPRAWFLWRALMTNKYASDCRQVEAELEAVLNAMQRVDSRFDPAGFSIDSERRVYFRVDGERRELATLSAGFRALLGMIQRIVSVYAVVSMSAPETSSLLEVPGVVVIDEIDAHLHVKWQAILLPTLAKVFPKTTFIAATHSPFVLARLGDGQAYRLDRVENTVRTQPIRYPARRLLSDVLDEAFGFDVNEAKREDPDVLGDQRAAKAALLALLEDKD